MKKIKLFKKQQLCFQYLKDKKNNVVFYSGSAGCGKTRLGIYWLITSCLMFSGSAWAICRNSHTVLYNSTFKTFMDICKELDILHYFTVNRSLGQINFENGSIIYLLHTEFQPSDELYVRFGGLEISGLVVDEAELSFDCFQVLKSRIRYKLDEYDIIPKILITSNPQNNWTYDYFWVRYKNKCLPENIKMILTTTTDNPTLSQSYIDELDRLPSPKRERLFLGMWEYNVEHTFFDRMELNMLFNRNRSDIVGNKYITVDVSGEGNDNTIVLVWNDFEIIDFFVEKKTILHNLVIKIKAMMQTHGVKPSNVVIDSVGIGTSVQQDVLGSYKFLANLKAIDPSFADLRSECIFMLKNNMYRVNLSKLVEYADRIIREFTEHNVVEEDKNRIISKKKIKEKLGFSPDFFDAIYMRFVFLCKKRLTTSC
jgi:hypothetical protein